MPATEFLRHHWPAIIIGVTAAAIACAAVAMLGNMPPHRIVMATGPEGEAYYRIGERYREALARENVEVQLVATAGSVGNLALLRDARGGASAALIEGGIPDVGDISPTVQQLLADERVALAGFTHADAFVALFPFLNKVVVPRGVVSIPDDRPPANVVLIATRASLVVRKDVHPAIQYLLLNAAVKIHSAPSIFHPANAFPAAEAIDIPERRGDSVLKIGPAVPA